MADTRRLEMIGGTSAKFYEVTVEGDTVRAEWGRIGKTPCTKSCLLSSSPSPLS